MKGICIDTGRVFWSKQTSFMYNSVNAGKRRFYSEIQEEKSSWIFTFLSGIGRMRQQGRCRRGSGEIIDERPSAMTEIAATVSDEGGSRGSFGK